MDISKISMFVENVKETAAGAPKSHLRAMRYKSSVDA